MMVSVILVNYNDLKRTREAVKSVKQWSPESEIIVVDNNSKDESVEGLRREFPDIKLLSLSRNRGFGAGNNRGAAAAHGEYLFFLNSDTLLLEDTPSLLAAMMEAEPQIAACGPRLVNGDNTFQLSFGPDPSLLNEWKLRRIQRVLQKGDPSVRARSESRSSGMMEVDWVTGAAIMVRRDVFEKVRGFDETFFMYFEDADVCRRIRKLGWKVLYVPATKVVHLLGQSIATAGERIPVEYRKSQVHYYQKHSSRFAQLSLRLYLIFKFGTRRVFLLRSQSKERSVAEEIIRLALRSPCGKS
jgi:GT2 family glycosyltransferase